MNPELQDQLNRYELELTSIRKAVDQTWTRLFFRGLIHGGGFVLGTASAIALGGWLLSVFGFIPGLEDIASNLQIILQAQSEL